LECGGSSVEVGVEQPAGVVMEWMATITGDRVGYPRFLGIFLCGEKFWRTVFRVAETEHSLPRLFTQ
jgi:hypothetical protein